MSSRNGHRRGISRPEILLLLSVLLGVFSILVPALLVLRDRQATRQAYSEIRVLVTAAQRFNREYRLWPVVEPPARGDARFGWREPNARVLRVLSAVDGDGNEDHRGNPARIDFITEALVAGASLRVNRAGEILDPWGQPYQMVFDSNYDSVCTVENNPIGPVVGTGVIIWSYGPDKRPDTGDDVRSWRY